MTTRPRTPCIIVKRTKKFDDYGRPKFQESRCRTKCDVIQLTEGTDQTTLRLDTSGSHGRVEETVADAKLILHPRENVRTGDLIRVPNFGDEGELVLRITFIQRRTDVGGRVHHIEIGAMRFDPNEEDA